MLLACTLFLAVMTLGETHPSRNIELITFGDGKNDLLVEEFFIPVPAPVDIKRKGKTASGSDCFCHKESDSIYLPPVFNDECICAKNCCKNRLSKDYLPPEQCEICPYCICDTATYTLINEESGDCPICRPPLEKKCECQSGKYIHEELGNCPEHCDSSDPPCRCINGRYDNELSGNCPAVCVPPLKLTLELPLLPHYDEESVGSEALNGKQIKVK